jgi:hypothetical protein
MLSIKLRDLALLRCSFDERLDADGDNATTEGAGEPGSDEYPEDQLLRLAVNADLEDDEVVCFIEGKLDDPRLPFKFDFEMAFLYGIPKDEPIPNIDEIQPTLVWLAFPHLREFIANITGRAASPQYFLPPLTRLPQPEPAPGEGENPLEEPESSE